MSSPAQAERLLAETAADADQGNRLSVAASVALHGALLLLVVSIGQSGLQATAGGARLIPVELVEANTSAVLPRAAGARVDSPNILQGALSDDASAKAAAIGGPAAGTSKIDALESKLEQLARLHQSNAEIQSGENREMAATGDTSSFGANVPYGLRDFLRSQVERRWHLDVSGLPAGDFSVPIQVEITRDGHVLKAEIANGTQRVDPVYHEVAASARNAVLAASPFALPPGRYDEVMQVVLELQPRATLR